MILGKGLIGTALQKVDRDDVLFCASGVSNLYGHIAAQRLREEQLLRDHILQHPDKIIVYFSSYSINDTDDAKNTPYLLHKRAMEELVKARAEKFLIVRTSNVVGRHGQPGNLTNFIYHHLVNEIPFDVWTETNRNLIDVEHLVLMADYYIKEHAVDKTVFIVNPIDTLIEEVVFIFEKLLKKKANYRLVGKGEYYLSDKTFATEAFAALHIDENNYVERLVQKYFLSRSE